MKKVNIGLLLTLTLLMGLFSSCREQSKSAKIVFNEIQTVNQDGFMDDYGQRNGWIELFNKSYGIVDIAGYSLNVTQNGNTTTYTIPKNDVKTKIQPRQIAVFYTDDEAERGTFHTSFKLATSGTIQIELIDNAGKFIDSVEFDANRLGVNQSWGLDEDGVGAWEVKDGSATKPVTPSAKNHQGNASSKMEKFTVQDPIGIGMALSAMSVVFVCLIMLFFAFKTTGKLVQNYEEKKKAPAAPAPKKEEKKEEAPKADGEVYAAIAMALHEMQNDVHDMEDMVLTFNGNDSAWASKSLTLRKLPNKN